jgi:hypothetical protein
MIFKAAPTPCPVPDCERQPHAASLHAKALLVGGLLLLTACQTAHPPAGETRGYTETQLSRNTFDVRALKNVRGSKLNPEELFLLRAAEVTLAYGFKHFVVQPPASGQPLAAIDRRRLEPTDLTTLSSPSTIICFRNQPVGYPAAYNAETVLIGLSGRHGQASQARANPVDGSPLQFALYPSFLFLTKTTPEQIVFLEPDTTRQSIVIGTLNDWENPCETLDEFKRKATTAAAILGAQAVQIQSDSRTGQRGGSADFVAALLLVPKARLGLLGESGPWPRDEMVVRGFDAVSLAQSAGLKIGDRILELNGVDVRHHKRFADGWLSWAIGETVVITLIRDGNKMSLQAKTIAN